MSQAYPQFTPVQILEAGQRAFGEGRTDYAAQFFQHLIDHYGDTAEAASARETMAQIKATAPPAANPQGQPVQQRGASPVTAPPSGAAPAPGHAPSAGLNGAPQGVSLGGNGSVAHQQHEPGRLNGHTNGQAANGYPASLSAHESQLRPAGQRQSEPTLGPAPLSPAPLEVPRPVTRPNDALRYQPESTSRPGVAANRLLVPAPEKNYIIGRVVAGLLLLIGVIGILAGIVLVYAALTDPVLFTAVGIETSAQAIFFAGSVFVGSVAALIASQMATAIFNGADAVTDLARLERYKLGDIDED